MRELTRDACITPEWPAPVHVKALVTTRSGGVSTGAYATLNLGFATEDDQAHVTENRARLCTLVPQPPRWLRQVHGAKVVDADELTERVDADASFARGIGSVCAILIADCLPILLTNRSGTIVGAAHAGWRGLAAGVIDNVVEAMGRYGARPDELLAYIGPGIGPHAFEVGDDVYAAFVSTDPHAREAFKPLRTGKWHADLFALARRALERSGVRSTYGSGLCTYSDPERFYSYRRDKITGRMAALIWIDRDPVRNA
jgi:purine-nucleoside/S-methyl-5'-thioadenosine phosphorylase / adenosine deaminase